MAALRPCRERAPEGRGEQVGDFVTNSKVKEGMKDIWPFVVIYILGS